MKHAFVALPALFACAVACASEPVAVPLDAASLAGFGREPVSARAHDHDLHCEGIALATLLRHAGAMPEGPLRGRQVARYVRVSARDGYRAVFALAEIDPDLGGRRIYLVDRCEGKPLDDETGPLRLIAPDDARAARWVRQLDSITVVDAP